MHELAALGRADRLIDALARRHLEAHREVEGLLYFNGHVRAYRRAVQVPEDDVARLRLSMGEDADVGALDRDGSGVLRWTAPAETSSIDVLRAVTTKVRELVGVRARPTICFDHAGWPSRLLAELVATRFDVVTYGRGCAQDEPPSSFHWHSFSDGSGLAHPYLLVDRQADLRYDGGRRRFRCRKIVGLEPRTGLQTEILTTRGDTDPASIVHALSSRSSKQHFVDSTRRRCFAGECAQIDDVVRMAAYNAESALARLLAPGHARPGAEAHELLRQSLRTPATSEVVGDELWVRLQATPATSTSRALAALCAALTSTRTILPGSDLTLVYTMEPGGRSACCPSDVARSGDI